MHPYLLIVGVNIQNYSLLRLYSSNYKLHPHKLPHHCLFVSVALPIRSCIKHAQLSHTHKLNHQKSCKQILTFIQIAPSPATVLLKTDNTSVILPSPTHCLPYVTEATNLKTDFKFKHSSHTYIIITKIQSSILYKQINLKYFSLLATKINLII